MGDPTEMCSILSNAGKGHADIYSVDPENPKNKKRITPISGTYRFLSVSPDGKKLAFNRLYLRPVTPRKPDLGAGC